MGESSKIILENFQFLENIPQKYMEKSSTIVLENSQFYILGKIFPKISWEKFINFCVICVTNIFGKIPQKIF